MRVLRTLARHPVSASKHPNKQADMNQATEDISVEQFIARLDSLKEGGDKEYLHLDAEKVLLDYLRQSGRSDLADAFERAKYRVGFWYE